MPALQKPSTLTRSVVVLAVIAGGAALYLTSEVLVPFVLALVLSALLWPVVHRLIRWRIPAAAAAIITVLGTVSILIAAAIVFEPPIRRFANRVPKSIAAARPKLLALSAEFSRLTGAEQTISGDTLNKQSTTKSPSSPDSNTGDSIDITKAKSSPINGDTTGKHKTSASSATATEGDDKTKSASVVDSNAAKNSTSKSPTATGLSGSLTDGTPATLTRAFGLAAGLLGEFVEIVLLTLFILVTGNNWKKKLGVAIVSPERQEVVADTVNKMRSVVSRYVVVTALINLAQGIVIAIILKFLGYPSPWLWGILTFVFEFIPYFGGMLMMSLLLVAGLAADRAIGAAVLGPMVYLVVTSVQNDIVRTIAYGRSMRLNPTAILAGLMLWYMLWGVAGAFLAVPILAAFNVMAERISSLKGVRAFLSD